MIPFNQFSSLSRETKSTRISEGQYICTNNTVIYLLNTDISSDTIITSTIVKSMNNNLLLYLTPFSLTLSNNKPN